MEAITALLAAVITVVVAAAIFTGIDVYLALKNARGSMFDRFNEKQE